VDLYDSERTDSYITKIRGKMMNSNVVVRNEKLILVEATGRRTQIGNGQIVFSQKDGYEYPVAEIDEAIALPLLRGEELTQSSKDDLEAKLVEVGDFNKEVDKYNQTRPKGTPPRERMKVPEVYHGHFVNFRRAVPIKPVAPEPVVEETESPEPKTMSVGRGRPKSL
jgi:hypothetical protein